MNENPYLSPLPAPKTRVVPRPTLLRAVQTTWIAVGLCLVGQLAWPLVAAALQDRPLTPLIVSDDNYCMAAAAAAPVALVFGIGTLTGWRFQSLRVEWIVTIATLTGLAGLAVLADWLHDFGEGDQMIAILGILMFVGGLFGSVVFAVRNRSVRAILCVVPHAIFAAGYGVAVTSLLHHGHGIPFLS